MNNKELELVIKELLEEKNFFDLIEKAMVFEKDYKTTSFYKNTKMPLMAVLEKSKLFYAINLEDLFKKLQEQINNLDTTKLMSIINEIGELFENENSEILNITKEFSELNK